MVSRRIERKRKRRKERFRKISRNVQHTITTLRVSLIKFLVLLLALLLLMAIGMLLFSPILDISEIRVARRDPRLDIEEVQQMLSPMFHRHLFFVSRTEVIDILSRNVTDLAEVEVEKEYPSTLRVSIALDPLIARIVIVEPEQEEQERTATGSSVDFITNRGYYVFAPSTDKTSKLPDVRLVDWGVRPLPGSLLLEPSFLQTMEDAEVALVRQFGFTVRQRTVYLRAQEFHLRLDRFAVWFDLSSPLGEQLEQFRTLMQSIDLGNVQEYIDLRIADRVVYK